jgi:hypothetical protein
MNTLAQIKAMPGDLSYIFMTMDETENNGGQSTVRLGDLYSVCMKLAQSKIQTAREVDRVETLQINLMDIVHGSSIVEVLPSNN